MTGIRILGPIRLFPEKSLETGANIMSSASKNIRAFAGFFILVGSFGCATPYQPSGYSGGYSDFKLGDGKYMVTFDGNGFTSASTVRAYAYRRAKEICESNGFSDFEQLSDQESTETYRTPDNYSCNATTHSYGLSRETYANCTNTGGHAVYKPGISVSFTCIGSGKKSVQSLSRASVKSHTPTALEQFGITLSPGELRSGRAAIVERVRQGTKAEAVGLRSGDRITAINGDLVRSAGDIKRSLLDSEDGKLVITVCDFSGDNCRPIRFDVDVEVASDGEIAD